MARMGADLRRIHYILVGSLMLPFFNCIGSAPEAAFARPTRALARRTFAKNDPALAQVIGCQFHVNAVTHHRTDPEPAHFAGCIGDNSMLIVQGNAKAAIRQNLIDLTLHRNQLFLRQTISRSYNTSRARVNPAAKPSCEKGKIVPLCGLQIPSQTTSGNFYIAQRKKITRFEVSGAVRYCRNRALGPAQGKGPHRQVQPFQLPRFEGVKRLSCHPAHGHLPRPTAGRRWPNRPVRLP